MELIFLGTGAGKPSQYRNVSSIMLNLEQEGEGYWLFDCGEATQHQLLRAKMSSHKIEKIFITHLHGDHLLGLVGVLCSRDVADNVLPITVYGPEGLRHYLDTVFTITDTVLGYPLHVKEIQQGIILDDGHFRVEAAALDHRILSFGYRIVEYDRSGSLDTQKLLNAGIQPGRLFSRIKKGETVTLENGTVLNSRDYLTKSKQGKVIAIFGDTRPVDSALELARNADVLIHEATMAVAQSDKAEKWGHSTTVQVATLAKESNAKTLIITHISQRYNELMQSQLLAECQSIFPNTLLAEDFMKFSL